MKNVEFIDNLIKKFGPVAGLDPSGLPSIGGAGDAPLTTNGTVPTITDLQPRAPMQPASLPPISTDQPVSTLPPVAPVNVPDTPEYQMYQQNQLPAIGVQPAVATTSPSLPAIGTSLTPAEARLAEINSKTYNKGVWRNPATGETTSNPEKAQNEGYTEQVTAPGNSRKKHWSTLEKVGGALVGWATGGLGEGIRGATDRNYFSKLGDNTQRAQLLPVIGQEQQIANAGLARAKTAADIANIYDDNATNAERIKDLKEARASRVKEQALQKLNSLKYYDPKNQAHRALATAAGVDPEDMTGWDDRNPIEKTVNGKSYRLDRNTGAYAPTGLPDDELKTLVPYDVKMPNGEMRTYNVPQQEAAKFATQMQIMGAQIASREKVAAQNNAVKGSIAVLNNSTKTALEAERQKHGDEAFKQRSADAFKKAYYKRNRKNPSQAEVDNYLNNIVPPPVTEGQ